MVLIGDGAGECLRPRQPYDAVAYAWYNLAVASWKTFDIMDIDVAVAARDNVLQRLTADQRLEAQRVAREWETTHPHEP